MKNLLIFGLLFLASCSKNNIEPQTSAPQEEKKQSCDFGIQSFNLVKRPAVNSGYDEASKGRPKPGAGGTITTTTPPPPAGAAVILLDFDGQLVSGTSWNYAGDINCAPANLTADAINLIVQRVANDYSPFNVIITTDEAVFNATSGKRMRVIITESWEWYGQSGGVAFLNTFAVGSKTPCFVFSSLLSYNTKNIAEAASHEAGHTIGLYHQSTYDATGVKTSEYNSGVGTGETGWAPIMGVGYYRNLTLWHKGPNAMGASSIQDDEAIIAAAVGYKADDYSNTLSGAVPISSSMNALISNPSDVDFFSVNVLNTATLSITPFNVGLNNIGANVDLVLKIYNTVGIPVATYDNLNALNTEAVLTPGSYIISVGAISNSYTSNYGMIGKYSISLN
ncbi:MAG TPA: M57 family metalloprotease [Chitinophagaceae bacterium]